MAHESPPSRSSSKLPFQNEVLPTSPLTKLSRLRGKAFGQSVVDFDLDEEYSSEL